MFDFSKELSAPSPKPDFKHKVIKNILDDIGIINDAINSNKPINYDDLKSVKPSSHPDDKLKITMTAEGINVKIANDVIGRSKFDKIPGNTEAEKLKSLLTDLADTIKTKKLFDVQINAAKTIAEARTKKAQDARNKKP